MAQQPIFLGAELDKRPVPAVSLGPTKKNKSNTLARWEVGGSMPKKFSMDWAWHLTPDRRDALRYLKHLRPDKFVDGARHCSLSYGPVMWMG